MIDWDKVPQDRIEEAKRLEQRISNIEAGYVEGYNNLVARVGEIAQILAVKNNPELIQIWKIDTARLRSIYENVDFSRIPRTADTEPYFACRQYYHEFMADYISKFGSELEQGKINKDTAEMLSRCSKEVCAQGSRIPRYILRDLQKIQGCERREIRGVYIPKTGEEK